MRPIDYHEAPAPVRARLRNLALATRSEGLDLGRISKLLHPNTPRVWATFLRDLKADASRSARITQAPTKPRCKRLSVDARLLLREMSRAD